MYKQRLHASTSKRIHGARESPAVKAAIIGGFFAVLVALITLTGDVWTAQQALQATQCPPPTTVYPPI